jgi:hypothetical protein
MGISKGIVYLVIFLATSQALAVTSIEYCQHVQDPKYFKTLAYNPANHLSIVNQGGLLDGGTCWWHSLFQRKSFYLAIFEPRLPKPTSDYTNYLINTLAWGEKTVVIPGYSDMNSFSRENWSKIQSLLDFWQDADGFLKQKWINSVAALPQLNPTLLRYMMDKIFDEVENKQNISWVLLKAQGWGVESHAWLIVDMIKSRNGYDISLIDSNYPLDMRNARYELGSKSIQTANYGPLVMYLGRTKDLAVFEKARREFCR